MAYLAIKGERITMPEFTPITSQEEFDALIKDRIERAKESVRKEFADYEELRTRLGEKDAVIQENAGKLTGLQSQVSDLTAKLNAAETDSVKTRIAFEAGLPFEMLSRLRGSTEDEIRADAKELLTLINVTPAATAAQMHYKPNNTEVQADKALRDLSQALKAQ